MSTSTPSTPTTKEFLEKLLARGERLQHATSAVIIAAQVQYEVYGAYPGLVEALQQLEAVRAEYVSNPASLS